MITVVTPFNRTENKDYLIKVLQGKCNWIILQAEGEKDIEFPDWVKVLKFPVTNKTSISNRLFNEFISTGLEPETQYMLLNDDDSVEDGFFDKVPNEDVVCVSMKRNDFVSQHAVWDDWATKQYHYENGIDVLIAKPENMKVARVGGEQFIVKGKILKNFRYGLDGSTSDVPGDFRFIRNILDQYTPTYVPDAHILFNYFEDGRFKGFRRRPLALFIGDYWCAGQPRMGLSEWEGNIANSLNSTGLANVACFHFDKYYFTKGVRGDQALIDAVQNINPDFIVLIVYKPLGSDPTVMHPDTLGVLHAMGLKIITVWGDLEAPEQRMIANTVKPYTRVNIGTANKEAVEGLGFKYMHVPKDTKIWNNPNLEREFDVIFLGSYGLGREERQKALQYLINNKVKLICGGSEGRDHFPTEEYASGYKRAKMTVSFSKAHGMNVVNARVFEAMSCGTLLLEQDSPELAKLYAPFVDYVPWKDESDLLAKVKYYLEHEDERKQIALNGQKKTEELYSAKSFWEYAISQLK